MRHRHRGFTIMEMVLNIAIGLGILFGGLYAYRQNKAKMDLAAFTREFQLLVQHVQLDYRAGRSLQERSEPAFHYSAIAHEGMLDILGWEPRGDYSYKMPFGRTVRFDWAHTGGIGAQRVMVTIETGPRLCRELLSNPGALFMAFGQDHNILGVQVVGTGFTNSVGVVQGNAATGRRFGIAQGSQQHCLNRAKLRVTFDPLNFGNLNYTYMDRQI